MSIAEATIERLAGAPVVRQRRFPGGDISGASEVTLADGRTVVAKQGPVVDAEGRMLEAMGRSAAPVPRVLGCKGDVLVIEHLPDDGGWSGSTWSSLAEALDALHAEPSDTYGWDEDYALRQVRVENARKDGWVAFWAENRLLCHVPHLPPGLARRVETLAGRLGEILPDSPRPSLLHGDLWGGNILVDGGKVSGLIDPCAFYGDREVDAATLTVFDAPPRSFFDALDFEAGWQGRQPAYRLWMWLVHVRLFGSGYASAVDRDLAALSF